ALIGRLQARRAMPYPLLAVGALLGFVECVDVEHGFPLRLRLAVLVERGAAPQAALVLRVLPEVVVVRADLLDAGDLGVGVEDLADVAFQLLELRRGGERR